MAHQPSLSSAHSLALSTRKNLCCESPGAELGALGANFTEFNPSRAACKSVQVIYHTPKYANTQMRACDSSLQQALIKLCSWAPLLLSPCDWCLASLALTNAD